MSDHLPHEHHATVQEPAAQQSVSGIAHLLEPGNAGIQANSDAEMDGVVISPVTTAQMNALNAGRVTEVEAATAAEPGTIKQLEPSSFVGDLESLVQNTPTKSKQGSALWHVMKRLPVEERGLYPSKTHVCTAPNSDGTPCRALLRLSKVSGTSSGPRTWQTGKANGHLLLCHPTSTAGGIATAKRKADDMENKEDKMFAQGMNMHGGGGLTRFTLTNEERALTSQARWYIYSRMHISKREFEAEEFREMLREQAGGRGVLLSQMQLREWVRAEFRIFLVFLRYAVAIKMEEAKGNAFAQALHDGGTLTNHTKYQALGIQFVSERGDANMVICLGLVKSAHNTDSEVSKLFKDVVKERTADFNIGTYALARNSQTVQTWGFEKCRGMFVPASFKQILQHLSKQTHSQCSTINY